MAIFHTISLLVVSIPSIYALSCIPCDQSLCVKPINCKGGLVKGVCGCCDVCAKTQGERCGGPWRIHGHCAKGLKCLSRTRMKNESGFLPKHFQVGICGPDVCVEKICGFKERCKINKSGRPMCICPRRCSKRRQPVCGLLNGKKYRNKCKLNREECFTKKEIGLIPGPCKKCTYQGQKYKFGDTRPDAKSCEICICRHGLWKCEIKLNCSTNSIPKSSKGRRHCLMSTNAIYVACPLNYSCRIPPSDDNNHNVRFGICKKVVYKANKIPMLLEIDHNPNSASVSKQGDGTEKITPSLSPTTEKLEISEAVRIRVTNHYVVKTVKPTTRELKEKKLKGGLIRHVCMADADAGTCSPASLNRWYYNASSKSCEQFQYSGCGGNFNNFLSKIKCQSVCHSELHRQPWNSILTTQSSVLYRVPELTEKPSTDMLLEMCHDIKTGMSYRNGETWNIDECISCNCVSGRDLCIAASCHATCSKPIHVKGKCCPICESDLQHTGNSVGTKETECKDSKTGVTYHSGESWNRNDCVHCICFEGETSCMTSVCDKPTCEQPIKKDGVCCPECSEDEHEQVPKPTKEIKPRCVDSDSGQSYTPGEAWKVNDCISCFCDQSGLSTCHKLSCPKSKCTSPVHLQGRCCPICPESFLSACNYDNRLYLQGDFMLLIDRCTLCKCKGTTWNCTKKHCNKTVNGIDSTFSVRNNKIRNYEHERNPSSDISGKLGKEEYFGSDNDEFIVEDPNRMLGRGAIASHKENATTLNNEKQLILNFGESATPSPSSHTGYQVETSTDTNENTDKINVKKSHLGSTKRPSFIDYKNRRWSGSWYQDALHVSDSNNDTIVYRTKRLL